MAKLSGIFLEPLGPAYESARTYDRTKLRHDVIAGLTVAVVALPQSMAYALVAGVPVKYGVSTLIIQSFIGALISSQRFLSVGPINTQSLLIASIVTRLAEPGDGPLYLQLVVGLTLIKGLMQTLMSLARLGVLARYVSHSAIVGFTAGAGVLIAAGQVHWLLGFSVVRLPSDLPGLIGDLQRLWPHLDEYNTRSILVGGASLVILIAAARLSKVAPAPLLAVIASAATVWALGWSTDDLPLVPSVPAAREALAVFRVPQLNWVQVERLFGGALALSLLGLMEAYSIGSTLAAKTGERIRANRELLSQGVVNTISAFFQCIPGSGSFTRSAINYYAGAKTCYAGAFNAVFVAVFFLLLARWTGYVPMAALAAVLFVIAYGLIDFGYLRRTIRSSRADTIVCLGTFLATLCVPLVYAVFIGVFLNIALYLRRAGQLHIAEMVKTPHGPFEERPLRAGDRGRARVRLLQIEGDLFFPVADELQDQLTKVCGTQAPIVILRLKRTLGIDTSVMHVLERFVRDLQARGGYVLLCGVKPELVLQLRRFGLIDTIGAENVFETGYGIFASAKQALSRAETLLDETDVDISDEIEGWSYEI